MSIIKSNGAEAITYRRQVIESIKFMGVANPEYALIDMFGRSLNIGDYVIHIKNDGNFLKPRVGIVVGQTAKKILIYTYCDSDWTNTKGCAATLVDWFRLIKIDSNTVQEIKDLYEHPEKQ